jgi:hypothetical protein
MHLIPEPGDMIPLETGDATILEVQNYAGNIRVLALREHPVHPFAVWHWDPVNGALYTGKYFERLDPAESYFWETT